MCAVWVCSTLQGCGCVGVCFLLVDAIVGAGVGFGVCKSALAGMSAYARASCTSFKRLATYIQVRCEVEEGSEPVFILPSCGHEAIDGDASDETNVDFGTHGSNHINQDGQDSRVDQHGSGVRVAEEMEVSVTEAEEGREPSDLKSSPETISSK